MARHGPRGAILYAAPAGDRRKQAPHPGDSKKGAELGGVGGALTGAVAGSMTGPMGAVVGALVGGGAGDVGSGAAVAEVDKHDNDDNISGLGHGVDFKKHPVHETVIEDDTI